MSSLRLKPISFEPVYGWLEQRRELVEVWGLENGRRAALLAYCEGPDDDFGWSNWARDVREDPSDLLASFDDLELEASAELAQALVAAFPGVFATD